MKNIFILILMFMSLTNASFAQDLQAISYSDGTQSLNGLVTSGTAKSQPGVLILPAWKGIDDEARTAARELSRQGYVVFIADIYGVGNIPRDNAEAADIASRYKKDYKAYQHRIQLALDAFQKASSPSKIAVIGYCFGGTGALETARAGFPVVGVVCIHGGLGKAADRPNTLLRTKILVEHPADDASVSKEDYANLVQELNEGNADWQIITYAHCKHTFTNPQSPDYNELMSKRAWQHTVLFLNEILK